MFDPTYAAYIFCLLTAIVVIFQLALALGAPWGEMAMGGRFPGRFPLRMRVAALVQIALLTSFAVIVLIRSGLMLKDYYDFSRSAVWVAVAFSALGAILNTITPSKKERALWTPVAIALLACVIYVAMS